MLIRDIPLFLPLAITAFGGPEGYSRLALIAFGAFGFFVPKYYYRLGKMDKRSLDSFILGGYGLQDFLGPDNLHTTPSKTPPDEEGLFWGWCVARGPLYSIIDYYRVPKELLLFH